MNQPIETFEIGQYRVEVHYDEWCHDIWEMNEYSANVISVHPEEDRLGNPDINDHYSDLISAMDICSGDPEIADLWLRSWGYVTEKYKRMGIALQDFELKSHMLTAFNYHFKELLTDYANRILLEFDEGTEEWKEYTSDLYAYDLANRICLTGNQKCWTPQDVQQALLDSLNELEVTECEGRKFAYMLDELVAFAIEATENGVLDVPFPMPNPDCYGRAERFAQDLWLTNPNINLVSLYDHSGICLQHGSGSCRWDSTPGAAMIICHPDSYQAWFKTLDSLVRGEVYTMTAIWVCPEWDNPEDYGMSEREVEEDSCGGFVGYEWDELEASAIDCFGLKDKVKPDNWVI